MEIHFEKKNDQKLILLAHSGNLNWSKIAMGNSNRFDGQIFGKQSYRGPKYRHLLQIKLSFP
jgi:hypothetical protein